MINPLRMRWRRTGPERSHPRPTAARRHRAMALVMMCVLVLTLARCTSARDTLGTTASPCFEALAIGADAVHDNGSFAGVHLLTLSTAAHDLHMQRTLLARFGPSVHNVCVVSYRGTFDVAHVARPLGPPPPGGVGHYAIVIVSKPQNQLLGTVIRETQPLRFGHPI